MAVVGTSDRQFLSAAFLPWCFLGTYCLVGRSEYGATDVALFPSFFLFAEDTPGYDFLVYGGVAGGICDVLC